MTNNHNNIRQDALIAMTYERMRPMVVRFVCRRLGNEHLTEAEDICQDVFLHILLYKKEITVESLPRLVYTIARNHVIDYFRHHARTIAAQDFFFKSSERARCTTEEQVAAGEIEQIEQDAVERMPERKAAVYLLYVHFGQSIDAISSSFNISRRTVENQIFRARQDIRATFDSMNICKTS